MTVPPAVAEASVSVAWSVTELPKRIVILAPDRSPEWSSVVMSGANFVITVVSPASPQAPVADSLFASPLYEATQ